ncbi:MAG: hypothetical protein ACLRWM_08550 [Streptococcus sp.]
MGAMSYGRFQNERIELNLIRFGLKWKKQGKSQQNVDWDLFRKHIFAGITREQVLQRKCVRRLDESYLPAERFPLM